jgi:hypothetical protein
MDGIAGGWSLALIGNVAADNSWGEDVKL